MGAPSEVLARVRQLCTALPGVSEVRAWGHPNFKVGGKTFAAFERYRGEWAIAFNAEPEHQRFLVERSDQFYVTPYVGKRGWVSMRVEPGIDWKSLKSLLAEAHRLTTVKRPRQPRHS